MQLKISKDVYGIVSRKKGEIIKYKPWPHEWQGMTEKQRVSSGLFVHCFGQGEFEVLRDGVDVEVVISDD